MSYTNGLDNPELFFQCKIYTGNGSTNAITFDGDENMQPDFIWIKDRGRNGYNHVLNDSVRGVTKYVRSNITNDEDNYTDAMTSFDSNGFTLGADSQNGEHNVNSQSYVAWCWKKSPTAGFDIVAYTGTGNNATANISHSLSAVPEFMWIKCRTSNKNNTNYHVSLGNTKSFYMDETNAASTSYDYWADTTPTSSVFTVKDDGSYDEVNAASDQTFIAWLWSGKQSFSKLGSYIGNGNDDGAFVYTGFRPAFVMTKRTDGISHWLMKDNKRDPFNVSDTLLVANDSDSESNWGTGRKIDFLSNGFKARSTSTGLNVSGSSYIYMAFAESPFVNSKGIPTNAR